MDETNRQRFAEKIELVKKSFTLKSAGKYKEALEALYKALEYNDVVEDNVELLSQVGTLHLCLNNHQRALDEFLKALSINPNHTYSLQKCFDIYIDTNENEKALELAISMCKKNKSVECYYNYFKILIKLGRNQEALELFVSLDDEIRVDANILYLISSIYGDKKKLLLERVLSIAPNHVQANLELAKMELESENYDNVAKYCANIDEQNSLIYYYMARVELARNNPSKALELLTDAIKIDNDKHDFYYDMARIYVDICWFDEALLALKKSINYSLVKGDNKNLDIKYFISGFILIKKNSFQKALINLNSIDESSKVYNNARILIETINLKNSNLSKAKTALEDLYEKEKDNIILIDSLSYIYKELKMYNQAVEMYNNALKLYPNSIYYKLEIIDILIDEKKYDEAKEKIEYFEKHHNPCSNIYNSLTRIYYRLKDYDNALTSIDKYLELDPNSAEGYYFKGLILNDIEVFANARNEIYTAIKLNPSVAKYYFQMAKSYEGLKDYKAALLYVNEAIELNQNEINYKKFAYETALKLGDKAQTKLYEDQMKRSEQILKLQR